MKTKIKQIIYDLRHQPVIAWVTLIATAMSVFLVMVVMIMQRVQTAPFAPESCRDRLMVGAFLHLRDTGDSQNNSSSGLSYENARLLYADLEGVEHTSYFSLNPTEASLSNLAGTAASGNIRAVDAEFFKIFDLPLLAGRYFTAEEVDANRKVAVVAESMARRLAPDGDPVGATVYVDMFPYTIVGVVPDSSPLATTAHAHLYHAIKLRSYDGEGERDEFGDIAVALLLAPGTDPESLRGQVRARYAILETRLAADQKEAVYHNAPFGQEEIAAGLNGSNVTPDTETPRRLRLATYLILLLVPAINLSSMLHSRMRRRVSEIGVRRAFGCTRSRIILDIIAENFLVTLAGGVAGVALGLVFTATCSGLYASADNFGSGATPPLSVLISWATVGTALAVCFVLNLLSASIPAWQASRLRPVDAINAK